jgi:UDP-2,3-diacylglucosamine pyrophosphatase LpxH
MKKRVFISDLHMNDHRSLQGRHPYGWLSARAAKDVAAFLDYLNKTGDADELVILGDGLDTWVCPVNIVPQDFDGILTSPENQCIVDSINRLIRGGNTLVTYVVGNHDLLITEEVLAKYLPGIGFIKDDDLTGAYRSGTLLGAHGNKYAMFNAPDPVNSLYHSLPLGYFISRIAATHGVKRHAFDLVKDLLDIIGPELLPDKVVDAVLADSGLKEDDSIILPDETSVTIKEVKTGYADLYKQWVTKYGKDKAVEAIEGELGYLDSSAMRLCREQKLNLVLFGHTHDEKLRGMEQWQYFKLLEKLLFGHKVYANTGTWCERDKPYTFVEVLEDDDKRRYNIRLNHWSNSAPLFIKDETVKM